MKTQLGELRTLARASRTMMRAIFSARIALCVCRAALRATLYPTNSDKTVYGVDIAAPLSGSPPAQLAPEPAVAVAEAPGVDPWESQDPWACQPCAPEAQEGNWHLDPFGQKGGGGKKGARPLMACYSCLGLGCPSRFCAFPYGAGEQKSMPKYKSCGGFCHDTPACTSRGGGKYSPPLDLGREGW